MKIFINPWFVHTSVTCCCFSWCFVNHTQLMSHNSAGVLTSTQFIYLFFGGTFQSTYLWRSKMSFFSVELRYWQVPADVSSSTRGTNSWCKLLNHTFFQFKRVLFLSTTTMDFFIFTFVHKITFRETSPTHWFKYFSLLFQVSDTLVVSGCEGGKVKVWDIERACLLKVRTFFF